MKLTSAYLQDVYGELSIKSKNEPEFLQAVGEVLQSLDGIVDKDPRIQKNGVIERMVEPDRLICFQVPWVDDTGRVRVNRGYRVQFNAAIGPYKGGLRLHPSVTASVVKFLGFEQTFKNALTGLPMGGGKGGSDFDPKGKSDGEVMRFCQSFITELQRHIGSNTDVPAGDIGVGSREIGYMYGHYRRINNNFTGVFTGKHPNAGGSVGRPEATGFGLVYYLREMLSVLKSEGVSGKTAVVSGAGNVSIYTAQKLAELGAKVVALSDSCGYVIDRDGIKLDVVKQIKLTERAQIAEYANRVDSAEYHPGSAGIWGIPCELALPCATQNELDAKSAEKLVSGGVMAVAEGANMPCSPEAVEIFQKNGVLFGPGKAANAGGVSVSGLEMSQNSMRYSWTFEEVDSRLKSIMVNIFHQSLDASRKLGEEGNMVLGANIAGFLKVAEAMIWQGIG